MPKTTTKNCHSPAVHDISTQLQADRPRYWRSLSELNRDESFIRDSLNREFPVAASEFPDGVSRRRWMKLMGASLAMAGVAGCRYPEELIAPFVLRPADRIPGELYSTATNVELAGDVFHLLVSCVDGRPIKVEPNTDHPGGGVTSAQAQATLLELYDPDRARGDEGTPLRREGKRRNQSTWEAFDSYSSALVRSSGEGRGFAILMSPTSSPSTVRMIAKLQSKLPKATVVSYDPIDGGLMSRVTKKVFGKSARQSFDFSTAEVIVSLQSDFLGNDPASQRNAKTFAKLRDPMNGNKMSRLYVAEGGYTTTGAAADVRIAIRPSQMPGVLAELARRVAAKPTASDSEAAPEKAYNELSPAERLERFLDAAAADLAAAGEKGVVVVGEALGEDALVAGIDFNVGSGAFGKIQSFVPTVDGGLKNQQSLAELTARMTKGDVQALLILDVNAVHSSPGDVAFGKALDRVEHSIYLGMYDDETAEKCQWSLPLAHAMESWGDCIDSEGHYGVAQPQILPLLNGRTFAEVIAHMLDEKVTNGEAIVRLTADSVASGSLSDRLWRQFLHDGFGDGMTSAAEPLTVSGKTAALDTELPDVSVEIDQDAFEVLFTASESLYDGRFANNGWLQEMPQSLTKLTWDNAAIMSPPTAKKLGIKHGLKIALRRGDASIEVPVYEMPGCAPGVVSVQIGYGRKRVGNVGGNPDDGIPSVGVDVSPIRFSDAMLTTVVEARPRFIDYDLATTQDHWAIDELGQQEGIKRSFQLIREGTVALLEKLPAFTEAKGPHVPKVGPDGSLWEEPIAMIEAEKTDYRPVPQWGMSVDLTKCLGCNACVIACQSENNVPIVGKEQVGNSREMHWLRIDRYFQGDETNADIVQEPVACMHCETAPCEQVCPVAATVHTNEGINAMAYNRCIGTRYCANNCPYKVRRFNYFNYNKDIGVGYGIDAYPGTIESANRKLQQLVLNPDVTTRGRGVMEKCTYCVQRIEQVKINARKDDGRAIRDGEVVTACQAACPTNAIEFGNIADPESKVAKAREDIRSYGMLSQLNVKPRTTYLSRIRNTPMALMTRAQLDDLVKLKEPHHHGHHDHGDDSHGEHGDDGHDAHGDDGHDGHKHEAAEKHS